MNLIAIDIGNTNIKLAFYLDDKEQFLKSVPGDAADVKGRLAVILKDAWRQVPPVRGAAVPVQDAVIVVSSVKPIWTKLVEQAAKDAIGESVLVIGREIPLPMETGLENPLQVGTDRLVAAAAAYSVIEDAVVVADFGTAITIDLVDEQGVFMGGVIAPGFAMGARALNSGTAQLPQVDVCRPESPCGENTQRAINAGLYYSAVGLLETMTRKYAEQIGKWPHVLVTGSAIEMLKGECEFVDSWVSDLTVRGIMIAYKKYIYEKEHIDELNAEDQKGN